MTSLSTTDSHPDWLQESVLIISKYNLEKRKRLLEYYVDEKNIQLKILATLLA